eukprot:CAMPEP_0202371524 /NCGR_PEP_ID=MMETSP1127-20130417/2913_1 /ASSEMBLY_ACC=CAM_ASM_000462 /TAXON_ID=3047 /ORGANISM="Dunaliella tertiolecta, Strain CCMP1320" /LENGTH=838 /DNA_ID=CAMNT_0048967815 /DNA_START=272 /DNA_END=2788 /DNA_ORIENTATION=-
MPMPPPTVALAAQNNVKADADDAKAMIKAGKEQHRAAQLSSSSQHARSHRPASHGQPERSPAANASHAPSLVFKPNPSAHSLPKKKTGFKGLMETLSSSTSLSSATSRQKGAPTATPQKQAQAAPPRTMAPFNPKQHSPQDAQMLQLQNQVAVLMEQMSKMRQQEHLFSDRAPASQPRPQRPLRSPQGSSSQRAEAKTEHRLDQLDALVKRLETHLVERERANDSLKETVRRLEARLKKSEQQQNTPGLEAASHEAGDATDLAVGKAVGAEAGGAEAKEALIKAAKAAGEQAGRVAGLMAGKEASAGEYFPILQRLTIVEAAVKRVSATHEPHVQAMCANNEVGQGGLQHKKLALMLDEVAGQLQERLDMVEKELARFEAGFEAMQIFAKMGLEIQQDINHMRTEIESLKACVPGVQGTAAATEEASVAAPERPENQSDHGYLEEAVRLLRDNDSTEERANAALAASVTLKTEMACMRQLLNGMNTGIMQRLHDLEDRIASSKGVERGASIAGTPPKIGRSTSKRTSIQGSLEQDSQPLTHVPRIPPFGPIQEEALAARILVDVLNEVAPTLEATAASMDGMDSVRDSATKAGKQVDELSAGLMLVTTRLNERLTRVERALRLVVSQKAGGKGVSPETVFNNWSLPTRTSHDSDISSNITVKVQPRPLAPAPSTALPRAETSVQKQRGPVTRTASGNFNYIAPGSSSAHNTASDDNCELDLGQGPQHNRPLHPNSRVQIFYQNLKRPFGSTFNGNQSAAGSEDITNSSRITTQKPSSPPMLNPIASSGSGVGHQECNSGDCDLGAHNSHAERRARESGVGLSKMPADASEAIRNRSQG